MVTINNYIKRITPYKPGKPIEEVKREYALKEVVKLASNENCLGPSPAAVDAIKKYASGVNRYPDISCFALKSALSRKLNISPKRLIFGNGSDEIIDIIIKTFVKSDEEILACDKTFIEYKIIARQNGRRVKIIPLKNDFGYDIEKTLKNITGKTKAVFIANPNNPTGTYINKDEFVYFIKSLPDNVIAVIDEAYYEFVDADDFPFGLKQAKNIITLRTFSKIYGLAGLRIGYAIAQEPLIRFMERAKQPFNVNLLAQIAACAAIKDTGFIKRSQEVVRRGKKVICRSLNEIGLNYIPSAANFIMFNTGSLRAQDLFKKMLEKGVIIRELDQYGLNKYARVTIGTDYENKKFVAALKSIYQKIKRQHKNYQ